MFCSQSTWTADALSRRLDEWREVFAQWSEGELFTGEAGEAVEASALAEASREMRKLGTAELATEPLAYLLDTETSYPAIVGPDGERTGDAGGVRGAVRSTRDATAGR